KEAANGESEPARVNPFHGMLSCRKLLSKPCWHPDGLIHRTRQFCVTGMTPAVQLEILDLRHFSAGNLRPVLEAEGHVWSERLRWDFRASANLLLQYLDSHVLPGYVALESG